MLKQTLDSFGAVELERILLLLLLLVFLLLLVVVVVLFLTWHYGPKRTFASLMYFSR
jgi:hypothetical protein